MEVRLSLVDVMRRFEIRKHGALRDLTTRLKVSRQTASKLINGRTGSVSFAQLGRIREWLLAQVPAGERRRSLRHELPGALIRFTGAWDSILQLNELILHLGERYWATASEQEPRYDPWIAGSDASVATSIVRGLTTDGAHFRQVTWRNVPLHLFPDRRAMDKALLEYHRKVAQQRFEELRACHDAASLIIGSQRTY